MRPEAQADYDRVLREMDSANHFRDPSQRADACALLRDLCERANPPPTPVDASRVEEITGKAERYAKEHLDMVSGLNGNDYAGGAGSPDPEARFAELVHAVVALAREARKAREVLEQRRRAPRAEAAPVSREPTPDEVLAGLPEDAGGGLWRYEVTYNPVGKTHSARVWTMPWRGSGHAGAPTLTAALLAACRQVPGYREPAKPEGAA